MTLKIWYGLEDLQKDRWFYNLGPAVFNDGSWERAVFVRGERIGSLRPEKPATRVLSALEADEGEG